MKDVVLGKYIGVEIPTQLREQEKEEVLIKILIKNSQVKVSEKSVNDRGKRMAEEYALRLSQQGLSIEQYYQVAHTDEKAMLKKFNELAKRHLKGRAILEKIAKQENIIVTEEEMDNEIEKLSMRYLLEKKEVRQVLWGEEEQRLKNDISVKKAMEYVKKCAVEAVHV